MTDREAYIVLNLLNGIGPARTASLVELLGSPAAILSASAAELMRIRGISEPLARKIASWETTVPLREEMHLAENAGVEILTLADDAYPQVLREIHDSPLCLYVRGTIPDGLDVHSIAMVGTRNASIYGMKMARHLAESAAFANWVTVSGIAVGIDSIVHQATVDAGGKTIAVLGGGMARFHPQENVPLARNIIRTGGAIVSEFPMTLSPSRHTFPMRNRIISALSLGTIVVEASLNSGSLITAAQALEQGKRVFAVPGEADVSGSNGCNDLIRHGAVLVENFDHVLEDFEFLPGFHPEQGELFRDSGGEYIAQSNSENDESELLSESDQVILDALQHNGPLNIDHLADRTGLPANDIMSALVALEILRRIKKNPDGTFQKVR